jgi:hypothetical protein
MAWSFDVNAAVTTSGGAWLRFKQALVSAGWTVLTSGTGTAGSYSSNSDIITTEAQLNNTNTWFVIKHPTKTLQICIQITGTNSIRLKYSAVNGFIGGSPSAIRVPSSTDEFVALGGGTDASPSGNALFNATNIRCNIITGDTTENYSFLVWANTNATSGAHASFYFDGLKTNTYISEDPYNYILGVSGSSSTALTSSTLAADPDSPFLLDTLGIAYAWRVPLILTLTSNATTFFPSGAGTDVITGNDLIFPVCWARIGLTGSSINGNGGWKGFSPMLHWLGLNRTYGDTLSINSTKDYLVVGGSASPTTCHVAVPWNGSDLII